MKPTQRISVERELVLATVTSVLWAVACFFITGSFDGILWTSALAWLVVFWTLLIIKKIRLSEEAMVPAQRISVGRELILATVTVVLWATVLFFATGNLNGVLWTSAVIWLAVFWTFLIIKKVRLSLDKSSED